MADTSAPGPSKKAPIDMQMHLSAEALSSWAAELTSKFYDRQIILLKGTLGAGKTFFVQECLKSIGINDVESPTYSLINHYEAKVSIYHLDLYRIDGEDDLESIGFWDIFYEDSAWVFIEWPDRVPLKDLPKSWSLLELTIEGSSEETRSYTVKSL